MVAAAVQISKYDMLDALKNKFVIVTIAVYIAHSVYQLEVLYIARQIGHSARLPTESGNVLEFQAFPHIAQASGQCVDCPGILQNARFRTLPVTYTVSPWKE